MIEFSDHDQRQLLHRGKIQTFEERASARAAITDVREADDIFLLHTRGQKYPRHHRNHVAEMRDRPKESFFHVAEMDVEILAARRSPSLRHVLREDLPRPNAFDEY